MQIDPQTMTQAEAETFLHMICPEVYVECATERIFGRHKGSPILLAGGEDWKRAVWTLYTRKPRLTWWGYYTFD